MILPAAQETSGRTPRRLNSLTASREHRNWPVRLTPITVFQSFSVMSSSAGVALQAGVVDQDVDRAEFLDHPREHRLHLVLLTDVGLMRVGDAAASPDRGNHLLGLLGLGHIVDDHSAPALPSAIATPLPMPELAPVTRAFCPVRILRIAQLGITTGGRSSASIILSMLVVLGLRLAGLASPRLQQLGDQAGPAGLVRRRRRRGRCRRGSTRGTAGSRGSADRSAAWRGRRRPAAGRARRAGRAASAAATAPRRPRAMVDVVCPEPVGHSTLKSSP